MGTSVCLHSDELVSERPLERAWRSPMTHSLLRLRDETPSQPWPGLWCVLLSWPWLQWGTLPLAALSPHQRTPSPFIPQVSGDPGQNSQAASQPLAPWPGSVGGGGVYHVLVADKHLLGSQLPSGVRA